MKNSFWMSLAIVVLFLFLLVGWGVQVNNTLVAMDEGVKGAQSQVENVYQRRFDLIPNLVNTVKGYAKHEATVLEEVTRARASVGQVKIENPSDLSKFESSQNQITQALSKLMVVAEKYPDLKANQNFLELQSQLEGTENRITIERYRFNEASRAYNTFVRKFPQSLIASFRGFKEKPYFAAAPSAQTAPKVEF